MVSVAGIEISPKTIVRGSGDHCLDLYLAFPDFYVAGNVLYGGAKRARELIHEV